VERHPSTVDALTETLEISLGVPLPIITTINNDNDKHVRVYLGCTWGFPQRLPSLGPAIATALCSTAVFRLFRAARG